MVKRITTFLTEAKLVMINTLRVFSPALWFEYNFDGIDIAKLLPEAR
ncbi:MAG: hypothetical protein RM049_22580 [Nostoc sp. DedQUE04]|nr:hypothetical protein [Nostoc sp. DedQUE04]MDZ8138059.1 hypothetical protein [Nostoc sp. DedQUE04]